MRELEEELKKTNAGRKFLEEAEPCEDAISRSQALKELEESAKHHANDSREEVLLRRDRDIIRALPPVKLTQRWIPVSERLPKNETPVLVSMDAIARAIQGRKVRDKE